MTTSISSEAFEKNRKLKNERLYNTKIKMTTFIKTKFKISVEIDFCGPVSHLRESTISDLESPSNFQVKEEEKNSNRSINKEIGLLWFKESLEVNNNSRFRILIHF